MSYIQGYSTFEDRQEEAADLGLICVEPRDNELLVDIDEGYPFDDRAFDALIGKVDIVGTLVTVSASGKGEHHYIRLGRPMALMERVLLQACLGSDPVREIISLERMWNESELRSVSVLFETPKEYQRVMNWREKEDKNANAA